MGNTRPAISGPRLSTPPRESPFGAYPRSAKGTLKSPGAVTPANRCREISRCPLAKARRSRRRKDSGGLFCRDGRRRRLWPLSSVLLGLHQVVFVEERIEMLTVEVRLAGSLGDVSLRFL